MTQHQYIAIDISKHTLAVVSNRASKSYDYTPEGLNSLLLFIAKHEHPVVVCEATGGYEKRLMETLREHEIGVALVNPSRVRAFARSDGLKAKTDPIDAALLLRFAQSKGLTPSPSPSENQQTLQALMDRRSQLTEAIAREKNRLEKASKYVRKSIEKTIKFLEDELNEIDKQIEELLARDKAMSEQSDKIQSIKGVGRITAWSILAYLAEIIKLSRNQTVALAGIAPYDKDSGKHKGKRRIEGGRAKVRKCLYMAAQTAAIHNPVIKTYVEGLRKRGKPYKVAIVAAMRKLLIHIHSLIKNPKKCLA